MAGTGLALPGGLPHPGEVPVTDGALHEFLVNEHYVTEQRVRQVVGSVVQKAMEDFQETRRELVAMVDKMTEVSSHFDTRVNAAESELTERQA